MVGSVSRFSFLFEHDLFGKPDSTFPDHALRLDIGQSATSRRALEKKTRRLMREESYQMSIGTALKLFVLAVIVFAVAFGLRRTFFWDVTPVSWDQEPQSLWALGAAFLLRTLENIAAVVAGLTLIVAGALRLIRWRAA
jgi:hypothetical protein